jgi:hypothetical protein
MGRADHLLLFPFYPFLICLGMYGDEFVKEKYAHLSDVAIAVRRKASEGCSYNYL